MCKLEHYGNCDPETKDREYCIFHKPNKNEKEAEEFWRKFLDRFKPKELDIDEETAEEVKIGKVKILIFENDINCRGFIFPDSTFTLERAIFKKSIDFSEAIFEGKALFNLAKFESAIFNKATFKKDALFLGVVFENAEFREVCFENVVNFSYAKFKRADFTYARFKGENNWFRCVKFGQAYFGEAEFENFVWFDGTEFGYGLFNLTKFGKYTNFSIAKFIDNVEFGYTTFRGLTEFIGTEFRGNVTFEGAEFLGATSFKHNSKSIYAKFWGRLIFLNVNFMKGISLDLPKECFKLPEAEAEACRVQRLWYEKEGRKDDADRMFVRERRALRRSRILNAKEQLKSSKDTRFKSILNLIKAYGSSFVEWLIADLTCEYGTNWKRPILLWLAVILVSSLIYWLTHSVPDANDFWSNLYFSIVTATTLGYGDLHPVGLGRALASFEAIFGTFMWAVFLLVFARKYMR